MENSETKSDSKAVRDNGVVQLPLCPGCESLPRIAEGLGRFQVKCDGCGSFAKVAGTETQAASNWIESISPSGSLRQEIKSTLNDIHGSLVWINDNMHDKDWQRVGDDIARLISYTVELQIKLD